MSYSALTISDTRPSAASKLWSWVIAWLRIIAENRRARFSFDSRRLRYSNEFVFFIVSERYSQHQASIRRTTVNEIIYIFIDHRISRFIFLKVASLHGDGLCVSVCVCEWVSEWEIVIECALVSKKHSNSTQIYTEIKDCIQIINSNFVKTITIYLQSIKLPSPFRTHLFTCRRDRSECRLFYWNQFLHTKHKYGSAISI